MSNEIDYQRIDETFPVAGRDNDTQKFRDNFDTIKQSLRATKERIEALEDGTAKVNDENDFAYNSIGQAVFSGNLDKKFETSPISGNVTVDFLNGPYQVLRFNGTVNLGFQNFPPNIEDRIIPPGVSGVGRVILEMNSTVSGDQIVNLVSSGGIILKKDPKFPAVLTIGSEPVFIEVWRHSGNNLYLRYLVNYNESADVDVTTINNIGDVTITGTPNDGQYLRFDSVTGKWVNEDSDEVEVPENIEDLINVEIDDPQNGEFLKFDGENWVNSEATIANLNDIGNVIITDVVSGDTIRYDSETSSWKNFPSIDIETTTVTVADNGSGNQRVFFFNGVPLKSNTGIVNNFFFTVGKRYRFDLSSATNLNAPLKFSTTPDTSNPSSLTPYTTNVTSVGVPGNSGAYIEILITASTPRVLYFYAEELTPTPDNSLVGAALPIPVYQINEFSGSEQLNSGAAARLDRTSSYFSTSGTSATATLAVGYEGQIKVFAMRSFDVGNMVITVSEAGWQPSGVGTITFSARGQACTLQFLNNKWYCIGNNGAVFG